MASMPSHHESTTAQGGVGDLTSDAKGSGARFSGGKPPMHLVPAFVIAHFLSFVHSTDRPMSGAQKSPATVLYLFGQWQQREGSIYEVMAALGGLAAFRDAAFVFGFGLRKYAAWNWAKGMPWSEPISCVGRHAMELAEGVFVDEESGHPTRGHLMCNLIMLAVYEVNYLEGDDRPPAGIFVDSPTKGRA